MKEDIAGIFAIFIMLLILLTLLLLGIEESYKSQTKINELQNKVEQQIELIDALQQ